MEQLIPAVYSDGTIVLERAAHEGRATGKSAKKAGERKTMEDKLFSFHADTLRPPLYWLLVLGTVPSSVELSPGMEFFRSFSSECLRKARETTPGKKQKQPSIKLSKEELGSFLLRKPPFPGSERVNESWLTKILKELAGTLAVELHEFKGTVDDYLSLISPGGMRADRVHFHLVENPLDQERPFAFLATYSQQTDADKIEHLPLSKAIANLDNNQHKILGLLAAVHRVTEHSAFIKELLDSGELFQPLALSIEEAHTFLKEANLYESAGILCKIPKWWYGRRATVKIGITMGNGPSSFSANAMLDVDVNLLLEDQKLNQEDISRILSETAPMAMIKGKWVAVDRSSLLLVQEQFEKARALAATMQLTMREAMKMIMEQSIHGVGDDVPLEISAGEWFSSVLSKLSDPASVSKRNAPKTLKGVLRPYQQHGFQWLSFLSDLGFGGCLADDMGLGKTLQMIALLLDRKYSGVSKPHLVIAPTSLLENWRQELARFAPDMKFGIYHSSGMSLSETREKLPELDILITSYSTCARTSWLAEIDFDCIVLDEAQAIKNPFTAQCRAVKKLQGELKFLMTGTPVENRLLDLWSLFDFANPGLLGTSTEFKAYLKKAEESPLGYGRLRQTISPYILRRMKTDTSIISDLPEKIEHKVYAPLSRKQAVLYTHLVERLETDLKLAKGPAKRGIVLSYIQKFKQLCNHPDQYAGSNAYALKDSGKFVQLADLCGKIREEREKVLVFTQFTEIIPALDELLAGIFQTHGVILTGKMPARERKVSVDRFQKDPLTQYFILSVRAGGVGLNLTAASQVIHFDRWWNPAAENQATDRAFRIGQKTRVLVHKLISTGTIEEKIDQMLEDKSAMAADVIGTGISAIMEMSNQDIVSLFSYQLNP